MPRTAAVIVPSFRRPVELDRCLRALAVQTRTPDHVVVAVRAGDAETAAVVDGLHRYVPALERVVVRKPGVVAALAAAVRRCSEEIIAHVDDDAVARPDWLARLLDHYEPEVGGVGGRDVLVQERTPRTHRVGRLTWYGRLHGNHHLGEGPPRDVHVLKGVCLSLRRELWRPDELLHGSGAQVHWELAMCLQARRDGWRLVYDPSIEVDHFPALRHDEDDRVAPTVRARADAEWNYAYALARWLPFARVPAAAAYGCLVGTRRAPGLLALPLTFRSPERRGSAARLFAAVNTARAAGVAAALGRRARGLA